MTSRLDRALTVCMEGSADSRGPMVLSDAARFEDLYHRYHRQVHAYCARRTPSDVQDLVAEVFLVAWRRIDKVPQGPDGLYWLYGVSFRVLNRRWRSHTRQGRAVERLSGLVDVSPVVPEVLVVQREEYRLVREAASRLKPFDQEILRLTLWEELTYREVADLLGIEVGAVKQRAHRARRRLAKEYRSLIGDPTASTLLGKKMAE